MKTILIFILIVGIASIGGWVFFQNYVVLPTEDTEITKPDTKTPVPVEEENQEMMNLTLYVQDKTVALTLDCGVTKIKEVRIPKTVAVVDASLKILFEEELAKYGTYISVHIVDEVAEVLIDVSFVSLSSCESQHLVSVIEDTLTQYDTIESIELYSPQGKIEF